MLPFLNHLLLISMGLYGLFILSDFISSKAFKKGMIESSILLGVIILFNSTIGFPFPKQTFGAPPIFAIGIMYFCTLLGTTANYFFYRKKQSSLESFIKPFFISPMIFFPLIGTVQGISEFEPIQLLSFGILAFQNGFFWKELFELLQKEKIREHTNEKK